MGSSGTDSALRGGSAVVVTVVRGHAERVSVPFRSGEDAGRISVGSRGDWCVSGPGVVGVHLWLNFDGEQLHAASADGSTYLGSKPLSSEWSRLALGDELRFGFALLRVTGEDETASVAAKKGPDPRLLVAAVGLSVLVLLVVVAVFASRAAPATSEATPATSSSSSERSATPASEPLVAAPEPAVALASPPVAPEAGLLAPAEPLGVTRAKTVEQPQPEAVAPALGLKPPAAYPKNIANRPVPRIGEQPWLIAPDWQAHHERLLRVGNRASARVVFLGDSITEGWGVAPAYRDTFGKYKPLNLGISGDTTQNVLWRLEHGALDGTQPSVVVLMIGINNLAGGFSSQQTADGVRAIVQAVAQRLPKACVLLLGILPAREDATNPLRALIRDTNRLLAGLAQPGRVQVSDVGAVLLESDGSISKATMPDYLHPSRDGFVKLSQAVAPLLEPLVGPGE